MKKIILIAIFIVNLLAVSAIWYTNSNRFIFGSFPQKMIAAGRITGLFAEMLILTQLILIGRIRFVEKQFGHDKLNSIHRRLGYFASAFILIHPLLLSIGHAGVNEIKVVDQFLIFIQSWEDVSGAVIGLALITIAVIFSINMVRKKLRYENWHFVHFLMYAAIYLALEHQIQTADLRKGWALYYWLVLNYGIFGLLISYRFIRPLYLSLKHGFKVAKIVSETSEVASVYIEGKNLEKFRFEPGQFANINFLTRKLWASHPFSFSADHSNKFIRFTIKAVGDFTSKVGQIKPGTRVIIDGPLGLFTEEKSKRDKFLFIAGGIGITPLRALAEKLSQKGKDVVLLYSNRKKNEIALINELSSLPIRTYYFITDEPAVETNFQEGRISREVIKELVPDLKERDVYICGPEPMMDAMIVYCKELEVNTNQIHYEKFSN